MRCIVSCIFEKVVKTCGKRPEKEVKNWKNKESHGVYSVTLWAVAESLEVSNGEQERCRS